MKINNNTLLGMIFLIIISYNYPLIGQEIPKKPTRTESVPINQEFKIKLNERYENNASQFYLFISDLKSAIETNDKNFILKSLRYPVKVRIGNQQKTFRSQRQMTKAYSNVFSAAYRARLLDDINDLHLLSQGIMLGRGSMWINIDNRNTEWLIITINN